MQAIVEIAGKQYRVQPNERHIVPHLAAEPGQTVEFRSVLALLDGNSIQLGTPHVAATVTATVRAHGKGEKVLVFKKKRRKGYKKLRGHRQQYT
ncbi:MAG: 50S ribosomal protein L21, partial [Chlorobiota bacterium]